MACRIVTFPEPGGVMTQTVLIVFALMKAYRISNGMNVGTVFMWESTYLMYHILLFLANFVACGQNKKTFC